MQLLTYLLLTCLLIYVFVCGREYACAHIWECACISWPGKDIRCPVLWSFEWEWFHGLLHLNAYLAELPGKDWEVQSCWMECVHIDKLLGFKCHIMPTCSPLPLPFTWGSRYKLSTTPVVSRPPAYCHTLTMMVIDSNLLDLWAPNSFRSVSNIVFITAAEILLRDALCPSALWLYLWVSCQDKPETSETSNSPVSVPHNTGILGMYRALSAVSGGCWGFELEFLMLAQKLFLPTELSLQLHCSKSK